MRPVATVDTNILSRIMDGDRTAALNLLQVRKALALHVCPIVGIELLARSSTTATMVKEFMQDLRIIQDEITQETWELAGDRFRAYALRRRKADGSLPRRLAADFIVGAHAAATAQGLITRDQGFYKTNFPELVLL